MAFKVAFIAHAPDANPEEHHSLVETPTYKLFTVVVSSQAEALEAARDLVKNEGVESILLCPGFTNQAIAELAEAVGPDCGVNVARGDGPSSAVAIKAMIREGWR